MNLKFPKVNTFLVFVTLHYYFIFNFSRPFNRNSNCHLSLFSYLPFYVEDKTLIKTFFRGLYLKYCFIFLQLYVYFLLLYRHWDVFRLIIKLRNRLPLVFIDLLQFILLFLDCLNSLCILLTINR